MSEYRRDLEESYRRDDVRGEHPEQNPAEDLWQPEPLQIAALADWLMRPDVVAEIAAHMPLCGGPRTACENRVRDVASALALMSVLRAEADRPSDD